MSTATWLLTRRTLIQFPRNPMVVGFAIPPALMMFVVFGALFEGVKQLPGFPTDNYFEYLAPAAVLMTTVPGIANAAGRPGERLPEPLPAEAPHDAAVDRLDHGRAADRGRRAPVRDGRCGPPAGRRSRAQVATGVAGALLMLLIGTLFAIVTFGVLTA